MNMKQIRVAFSGSGFLAPIHAGAICAFMDAGCQIIEVAGTSGGSIAAALVASGMGYSQIKYAALSDLPEGICDYHVLELMHEGLNDGEVLLCWLKALFGDRTFENAVVPITVMATDIDHHQAKRFNAKETPDVLLSEACRASASVPVIYKPFEIDGITLLDGGMCQNIPVNQLTDDPVPRFGIEVMDSGGAVKTDFIGRLESCLSTMLASNEDNLAVWAKQTGATIIPVSADPFGFLDAKLPRTAKEELFKRGYDAVIAALK